MWYPKRGVKKKATLKDQWENGSPRPRCSKSGKKLV